MKTTRVTVRIVRRGDMDGIVAMQKQSFPYLAAINVIWKTEHLQRHIEIFPEGQFCALYNGEVVGSASSLIIDLGPDPYRYHTWKEVTGGSFFSNHNPNGDTLYGADVSVHPKYRRLRIATAIYNARKSLCKKINLKRIVAGGRLFNYCQHRSEMSAEKYVEKVLQGELSDPVFSFQLKNGFKFIRLLPNYMRDPRSLNYATFIEWLNPDYKQVEGK